MCNIFIPVLIVLVEWLTPATMVPFPSKQSRLSIVDWTNYNYFEPEGPGTYAFGYDIEDPDTNNVQFRDEERHRNGTVTGSYGYVEPDGNVRIVRFVADEKGYRATEERTGLNLSMLKPIRLQDMPLFTPETIRSRAPSPAAGYDHRRHQDQRAAMLRQDHKRVATPPPHLFVTAEATTKIDNDAPTQINNRAEFDFYRNGGSIYNNAAYHSIREPTRYYLPLKRNYF